MDVIVAMITNFIREALLNLAFASPAILFIVFLVLTLIRIPKVKRKEERPAKLIIFAAISTYCVTMLIVEIAVIVWLAMAVAHM